MSERRTGINVPSTFQRTGVFRLILVVTHGVTPWQGFRLSMEVMFGPGLFTETVGRVKRVPSVGPREVVDVSRHDYTVVMR